MKRLHQFITYWRLRFRVWLHLRNVKHLLFSLRSAPIGHARLVLTKWRWIVAHDYPEWLRESMLDSLQTYQASLELAHSIRTRKP